VLAATLCVGAIGASVAQAAPPFAWTGTLAADGSLHINSLSCPSVSLCVAVDTTGNVSYTTTPASGGWSGPLTIDSGNHLAVSCASVAFCLAVDNHGGMFASTAPASPAWPSLGSPPTGAPALNAVSCPSTALCVAVDASGVVHSSVTPGTLASWVGQSIDSHPLTGVSCPTTSFCAAVDDHGYVLVTTTPTGNWQPPLLLNAAMNSLTGISCTASGLCVAVANDGNVYATADATAATPTWSSTLADAGIQLNAVSCSDVGVCALVDQSGNVLTSDSPAGAAPNWLLAAIDGGHALTGVSCLSAGLCAAVDSFGFALAGTLAAPVVTTGSGTAASQTTASVTATVTPNDATLVDCHFDYGPTTAYGSSAPCTVVPSPTGGGQAVSAALTGLNAATTYHFRIVAASGVAAADGADATFTTPVPLKPAPSQSGTPAVGSTLTCKSNATTTAVETVSYQWLRDTVPIPVAIAATYVVVAADAGHHLSCQVTIAGDGGSASATSGFASIPSQTQGTIRESFTGKDNHGATSASVPVTCSPQAAGSCKITLTLTVARKNTVVGSSTTSFGAGTKRTLSVSLNATGKRMLRNKRKLAVTLTVRGTVLGKLTATLQTYKFTFGAGAASAKATAGATKHAPYRAR
jgi:hypothetical protein